MKRLVTAFLGIGGIGIIAAILSVIKWGIFYFDKVYLLFSLSINGILVIIGFFGAWVIKVFDENRNRMKEYRKGIDEKIEDLNKDMISTQNRLLELEEKLIILNDKDLDRKEKLNEKSWNSRKKRRKK